VKGGSVTSEFDIAAWAKANKACFEMTPLTEMRGSERMQVGYNVDLYALAPMDKAPGEERRAAGAEIWDRLKDIVEAATREGGAARFEIEPARVGAVMRQQNDLQPEVNLRARVFHADEYFKAVTNEERDRLPAFEKRLTSLGLKHGRW
jgi:hypothetical protein